ncbi:class I SAM-dependent methyltransferase [Halomonas lysinitropha]|uniref:DUF4942 domain-containing protein n=1 Tax=Halomonas lysinitropha TaxID=2607506 RepID=A0A5K1I8T5_9GAMM|nr:class I SAM-dependent methyltransferase [Halomonas lysinitropha]VVZ96458.1 hypothetical protein HALO32_02558 [Halomonas lysinitropha]
MTDLSIGEQFFAPATTDMVAGLHGQYRRDRQRIQQVVEFVRPDQLGNVLHYFIAGNQDRRDRFTGSVAQLFGETGAVAALDADYWQRALALTDVMDFMPAERREEWHTLIREHQAPEFSEETVRATLGALLAQRMDFLAEKVDGIFRALSREHVTNRPEGFSKRLILTGVTNDWGHYGRQQTGHLNDLRQVVAKLMNRDEPGWQASHRLVEIARREHRGEWLAVDGGALRLRCYKNGNGHLEIHEDIAWQLNQILAHLHPAAIPSEFRTAPKRAKRRHYTLMERPLPFAVLNLIAEMRPIIHHLVRNQFGDREIEPLTRNRHNLGLPFGEHDKHLVKQAGMALEAIGGVKYSAKNSTWWEFDYDPGEAIGLIVASGTVPDHQSHQFYPTPRGLAEKVAELADIQPHHLCLEPSAGTGALADLMHEPLCIEVSALHCQVLEAKGYAKIPGDFLALVDDIQAKHKPFDRILMNPPFSQGRWQAHTEAAADLLAPGGRLVAILPASSQTTFHLEGLACTWQGPFDNQFPGASVSVSILIAEAA